MSSRGRGYGGHGGFKPRGGYSSYRGTPYRGGRGSYNDRGGRGGYNHMSNERYNSGGGDRYSARNDRSEEMSYKKSYRSSHMFQEGPSYGSREYSRVSPERKRMRMEGSGGGRRSRDNLDHYGGGDYGRRESPERRYSEGRRSPPPRDNSYRKSNMPPPRASPAAPVRSRGAMRSARRSYRGRLMRSSRASYRGVSSRPFSYRRILPSRPANYVRRLKQAKIRSVLKGKRISATSSEAEDDWDIDTKKPEDDPPTIVAADAPIKQREEGAEGEATDKEAADAASGEEAEADTEIPPNPPHAKPMSRAYIRLICTHCREKYLTFKMYSKHLQSSRHCYAMDDVALKLKFMQQRMRVTQRKAQRVLEAAAGAELSPDTAFCTLCKLIYRTTTNDHDRSEAHRNMKEFLMPYCKSCRITFRSPMIYEHHICSLDHIKKKARLEHKQAKPSKSGEQGSEDEGMDMGLENFMTLDSVGDVDEVEDGDSTGEKKAEEGVDSKPKLSVSVGNEHIKKYEVHYCELCKVYLPRGETDDMTVKRHCRKRTHLSRYVRFCDDHTLRRQAERIHRIHQQAKETKGKEAAAAEGSTGETAAAPAATKAEVGKVNGAGQKAKGTGAGEEGGEGEEKLWAEVDKELGDLLRDTHPHTHTHDTNNKSSDDEDDTNTTGRYDRFRKSDKKAEIETENAADESAVSVLGDISISVKDPESEVTESVEAAAQQ